MKVRRTVAVVACVVLAIGIGVRGQSPRTGTSAPADDELLREVRALRAELRTSINASIRSQLLVGRLQLQEQRLTASGRDLETVQNELGNLVRQRAQIEAAVRSGAGRGLPAAEFKDYERMMATELAELQRREKELRQRESSTLVLLQDEQARWTAFNAQLDEIERSLAAR